MDALHKSLMSVVESGLKNVRFFTDSGCCSKQLSALLEGRKISSDAASRLLMKRKLDLI
jgi:hypothetical protein